MWCSSTKEVKYGRKCRKTKEDHMWYQLLALLETKSSQLFESSLTAHLKKLKVMDARKRQRVAHDQEEHFDTNSGNCKLQFSALRGLLLLGCVSGHVQCLDIIWSKMISLLPLENLSWLQYTNEECNLYVEHGVVGPPLECALAHRKADAVHWLLAKGVQPEEALKIRTEQVTEEEEYHEAVAAVTTIDPLAFALETGDWRCVQTLVTMGACFDANLAHKMSAQVPHCLIVDLIFKQDAIYDDLRINHWRLPASLFPTVRAYLGHPFLKLVEAPGLNPLRVNDLNHGYPKAVRSEPSVAYLHFRNYPGWSVAYSHHRCKPLYPHQRAHASPFLVHPISSSEQINDLQSDMKLHRSQVREALKIMSKRKNHSFYPRPPQLQWTLSTALGVFFFGLQDMVQNNPFCSHSLSSLGVLVTSPCQSKTEAEKTFRIRSEEAISWPDLKIVQWARYVWMILGPIDQVRAFQQARDLTLTLSRLPRSEKPCCVIYDGFPVYLTSTSPFVKQVANFYPFPLLESSEDGYPSSEDGYPSPDDDYPSSEDNDVTVDNTTSTSSLSVSSSAQINCFNCFVVPGDEPIIPTP